MLAFKACRDTGKLGFGTCRISLAVPKTAESAASPVTRYLCKQFIDWFSL